MATTAVSRRKGTITQHNAFTGLNAEITAVVDELGRAYELRLHDGVTPGGNKIGGLGSSEITLEQFDAEAGTGGNDTAAFTAARSLAASAGGVLTLGANKTYLIDPVDNNDPYIGSNYTIQGSGGSVLKARTTGHVIGTVSVLPLTGSNIKLENFTVDGNISNDPVDWSTGYNAFTGSRGVVLQNVDGFIIERVNVSNVVFAGIAGYRVKNGLVQHCNTNRTRGNFGDGFYFVGSNISVVGCRSYDFTRIGCVAETNAGLTELSNQFYVENFRAEYGHDASILYGGVESNYVIWMENFFQGIAINCHGKNMSSLGGGGFNSVVSYPASAGGSVEDVLYANSTFINCHIDGGRYGFVVNSLDEGIRNMCRIENCSAINVDTAIYMGHSNLFVTKNILHVEEFYAFLSQATDATRGILHLGGEVYAKNIRIKYGTNFNQANWDSESNGYSAVGAFSTQSGIKCVLDNVRVYLNDDTEIPLNTKFRSAETRDNLDLEIRNCWVEQVIVLCKNIKYVDNVVETLGQEIALHSLKYIGGEVKAARADYLGGARAVVSYASHLEPVLFDNVKFNLNEAAPIHLFIQDRMSKSPAVIVRNSQVTRDFATNGHAFRLNAETTLKNDNNEIFNYEFNNCKFINTGGATTNPIIFTDGIEVDRFTALGIGNQKSSTLSVDGNATLLPLYLPVTFGKLKVEPTAITASRNLTSNDFNKTMQNSTSTAIVLTLGANQEALAPIGTEIELTKLGTGDVNFTPTAPSTVNGTTTFAVTTQYSSRKVRKVAAGAWATV